MLWLHYISDPLTEEGERPNSFSQVYLSAYNELSGLGGGVGGGVSADGVQSALPHILN